MSTDFTRNPGIRSVTLTTGTNDELGTISVMRDRGAACQIVVYLKNTSANPLTGFKAQCRTDVRGAWQDYLVDDDFVATDNGAQRNWSSGDPTDLAAGAEVVLQLKAIGISLWRFVASGTAGSVVEFEAEDVTPTY